VAKLRRHDQTIPIIAVSWGTNRVVVKRLEKTSRNLAPWAVAICPWRNRRAGVL